MACFDADPRAVSADDLQRMVNFCRCPPGIFEVPLETVPRLEMELALRKRDETDPPAGCPERLPGPGQNIREVPLDAPAGRQQAGWPMAAGPSTSTGSLTAGGGESAPRTRRRIAEFEAILADAQGVMPPETRAVLERELEEARSVASGESESHATAPRQAPMTAWEALQATEHIAEALQAVEKMAATMRPLLLPPVVDPEALGNSVYRCFHSAAKLYHAIVRAGFWEELPPDKLPTAFDWEIIRPLNALRASCQAVGAHSAPAGFVAGVPEDVQEVVRRSLPQLAESLFPTGGLLKTFTAATRPAPAAFGGRASENAHIAAESFASCVLFIVESELRWPDANAIERIRRLRTELLREAGSVGDGEVSRLRAELDLERTQAVRAALDFGEPPPGADQEGRGGGSEQVENSIRRQAKVWHLRYQGESGDYPSQGNKCLGWIAALVAKPNRSFPVAELVGDPEGKLAAGSRFAGEAETAPDGIRAMKARLDDVESYLELGGTEELAQEKAELLERIKRAEMGRVLSQGSPVKRAHHNISSQIRNFVSKKLAKDMPRLAAHLKASLKLEFPDIAYYPPATTPPWKT
jgi:hypothetical protein